MKTRIPASLSLLFAALAPTAFGASAEPKFCKHTPGQPSISRGDIDLSALPEITARTFEFTGGSPAPKGNRIVFTYSGEGIPTPGRIVLLRRQDREFLAVRIGNSVPIDHKVTVKVLCRYDEKFEQPGPNDLLTAIEKTGDVIAAAPPSAPLVLPQPPGVPSRELTLPEPPPSDDIGPAPETMPEL